MKRNALRCLAILLVSAFSWAQAPKIGLRPTDAAEQRTAQHLDSIRHQPLLLLMFLRAMPKGGDLHNHLSGAVYAESYIQWAAAQDNVCLNRQTLAYVPGPCDSDKGIIPAGTVLRDAGLYQSVINALSMRFFNGPESAHDHFFNSFAKFGLVSRNHVGEMLAEVVSRAAAQRESYLELMLAPDKMEAAILGAKLAWEPDFGRMRQKLLDAGLANAVAAGQRNLDEVEAKLRELLRCGQADADAGCGVTVRYQYEVHRGLAPPQVFAEMLAGFEMASADARVVAVNMVMPEDAYVPMRDFDLHMRMLDYLHGLYPKVNIGLHAGELAMGLVPPDGLRDHIRDSIDRGHAKRIGHGVDLMYERDPSALLQQMAKSKVLIEICLTSNDAILGVRGDRHPLPLYLRSGVPLAIATDDEGVARSDLTQEFTRAVETYNLSYSDIKRMVRNSLEYAFLRGDSLWDDSSNWRVAPACAHDRLGSITLSTSCRQWLAQREKATLQWQLEGQFSNFESGECCRAFPASPPAQATVRPTASAQ